MRHRDQRVRRRRRVAPLLGASPGNGDESADGELGVDGEESDRGELSTDGDESEGGEPFADDGVEISSSSERMYQALRHRKTWS
ncbi:MAG TPA: hypothetical protein VIV60_23155 [Polyangiaceae bacterium]